MVTGQITGNFSFTTALVNQQDTVNGEDIESIKIEVSAADIIIVPAERDDIHVKLSGKVSERNKDSYKLSLKEEGGTAHISVSQPKIRFQVGINITNLKLEVEVPAKEYNSLEVQSTSGDIVVNKIEAENMNTVVTSGDVVMEELKINNLLAIRNTSGDVRLKNTKALATKMNGTSGDLNISNVESDITVKTTSGDFTVTEVTGNINIEATSGDITIKNKRVTGNITADITSGDVIISYEEEPRSLLVDYKANSGSGVIGVKDFQYTEKREREILGQIGDGQYSIKVRTSSGDFVLR